MFLSVIFRTHTVMFMTNPVTFGSNQLYLQQIQAYLGPSQAYLGKIADRQTDKQTDTPTDRECTFMCSPATNFCKNMICKVCTYLEPCAPLTPPTPYAAPSPSQPAAPSVVFALHTKSVGCRIRSESGYIMSDIRWYPDGCGVGGLENKTSGCWEHHRGTQGVFTI